MSWLSAARNLTAHGLHRMNVAWENRHWAEAVSPRRQKGSVWLDIGAGRKIRACPYILKPTVVMGQHPKFDPPPGWTPRPDLGLDAALPFPWDDTYQTRFRQTFQPVKLWRNAIALARVLESKPSKETAGAVLEILEDLLARMRHYTHDENGAAFLENRFDYTMPDRKVLPAPWVSGIANAFAILACLRLRKHLDLEDEAQRFARAYVTVQDANGPDRGRWISFRDRNGYLWFEEYPRPMGQSTRVQNGHIFAILALHEMAIAFPGQGYDDLVRAGTTTIAAYAAGFRQPGKPPLYAIDLPDKPDYLPDRAVRQMYQLYEMTGAGRFLRYGDHFIQDGKHKIDSSIAATLRKRRATSIAYRAGL